MTEPVYHCQYRVLYGDTDAGGVVYYAHYLRFFEYGRTEFMRAVGLPYSRIEHEGYILPVVESFVRYKAPAKYDDLLLIETSLAEVKKQACRFHYRIFRGENKRPLTLGYTVHAATTREGKLVKLPERIVSSLQSVQGRQSI